MPAIAAPIGWSAYCEDCDWESGHYGYRKGAEIAANEHNLTCPATSEDQD